MCMTQADFDELIGEIERGFESSRIKNVAELAGEQWCYDVCTRINPQRILVVGFNPGAGSIPCFDRQREMCNYGFLESCDRKEQGSLSRIVRYLEKYKEHISSSFDLQDIGQTNYCFFRSKNAGQITRSDLQLCRPIFLRLLKIAKPSMILSFSSRMKEDLEQSRLLVLTENHPYTLRRGNMEAGYCSAKGFIIVETQKIPIYFLPHPNYRILGDVRKRVWDDWFGEKK